jgi:hypothetical protein
MINVACFCGCTYSIAGDDGACPECGERVTFARTTVGQAQDRRGLLGQSSTRPVDQQRPDELAA